MKQVYLGEATEETERIKFVILTCPRVRITTCLYRVINVQPGNQLSHPDGEHRDIKMHRQVHLLEVRIGYVGKGAVDTTLML